VFANFAAVTEPFAKSAVAMVPSKIFALVTASAFIVGFGKVPVKSPPAAPPGATPAIVVFPLQ
jgi:hypothetical protein